MSFFDLLHSSILAALTRTIAREDPGLAQGISGVERARARPTAPRRARAHTPAHGTYRAAHTQAEEQQPLHTQHKRATVHRPTIHTSTCTVSRVSGYRLIAIPAAHTLSKSSHRGHASRRARMKGPLRRRPPRTCTRPSLTPYWRAHVEHGLHAPDDKGLATPARAHGLIRALIQVTSVQAMPLVPRV